MQNGRICAETENIIHVRMKTYGSHMGKAFRRLLEVAIQQSQRDRVHVLTTAKMAHAISPRSRDYDTTEAQERNYLKRGPMVASSLFLSLIFSSSLSSSTRLCHSLCFQTAFPSYFFLILALLPAHLQQTESIIAIVIHEINQRKLTKLKAQYNVNDQGHVTKEVYIYIDVICADQSISVTEGASQDPWQMISQ